MRDTLARDTRGTYRRELGWKETTPGEYRQHAFHLGRDRAEALIRSIRLEQVWECVVKRWQRDHMTPRPLWEHDSLAIALAVAKGEQQVQIETTCEHPVPAHTVVAYLYQLRKDFPMIGINLDNADVQERGQAQLEHAAEKHADIAQWIRGQSSSQTLHQALDAFSEWCKQTCLTVDKQVSPFGMTKVGQLKQIKDHVKDMPLSAFNLTEIDTMLNHWRSRPMSKKGTPMSPAHCKDVIKRIREFIRWLHKAQSFEWRKPGDYEIMPIRIKETHEELSARFSPLQVETYNLEQIGLLFEYGTPLERVYMLLALNCGFGQAEVSSLLMSEIFFNELHPHYKISGSYVKRLRYKSHVYGEWQLWPITVQAIQWYLTRRPQSNEKVLLLTEKGRPLNAPTKGNHRNMRISNMWIRLRERIIKDHPSFPELSFNKLRKTGSDLIKLVADSETAGVFLAHGQTVRSDDLADVYTNRHYNKVFAAQLKALDLLQPHFAKVQEPFHDQKQHPALSLNTIRKIKDMRKAGFTMKAIATDCDLPVETVRYHCHKEK